jgi:hypothetical protein
LPVGLTVLLKVLVGPVHFPLLKVGVTIIVAVTGEIPEFVAVKVGMFPDPVNLLTLYCVAQNSSCTSRFVVSKRQLLLYLRCNALALVVTCRLPRNHLSSRIKTCVLPVVADAGNSNFNSVSLTK